MSRDFADRGAKGMHNKRPDTKIDRALRRFVVAHELGHARIGHSEQVPVALRYLDRLLDRLGLEERIKAQAGTTATDRRDPPRFAEFLLTALATSSRAEAAIGDLNERFTTECEKLGRPRAVRLYWARTLRSLWPLMRRAIGKALKWGTVIAAVRRMF